MIGRPVDCTGQWVMCQRRAALQGFGTKDTWQLAGAGAGRLYCRGGPGGRGLMPGAVARGRDRLAVS